MAADSSEDLTVIFFIFFSFLLNCPIKYSTALMAESDFA